jgi:hypothetical protein
LVEYLYGVREVATSNSDNTIKSVSKPIKSYKWKDKEIPSGFFFQAGAENVSAVLANPSGTLSKFNRMGFIAGFGDRDICMIRTGVCYRDSLIPQRFVDQVHAPEYAETWVEGLSVYHNPRAKYPLHEPAIPGAAHHTFREGRILSGMPRFHPVGSVTMIVVPTGSRRADRQG